MGKQTSYGLFEFPLENVAFEHVGPIMSTSPLDVGSGLLPTL